LTLTALGMVAVVFCNWLFYGAYRARKTTEAEPPRAAPAQIAALSAVIAGLMIGVAIASVADPGDHCPALRPPQPLS
jgi:hypothetical protein